MDDEKKEALEPSPREPSGPGPERWERKTSRFWTVVEEVVEKFLWNTRFVIMLGVFGLLMSSMIIFMMGIIETFNLMGTFLGHLVHHGPHFDTIYNDLIVSIITTVDDFLLGTVLLIFGLGTYDLFISRLDPAIHQEDVRPDWMVFGSLEELKSVLGKIVLMILTINFLKWSLKLDAPDPADRIEPISLLWYGAGVALVSLALKWAHAGHDIEGTTLASMRDKHERTIGSDHH